jgi:hypothetical protein
MAPKKATKAKPQSAEQQPEGTQIPEQKQAPEQEQEGRSMPLLVPEMHVRQVPVPVPNVRLPMPESVRDRLPEVTPGRMLWWGGLVALAATDLISWPVAGVVAVGVYVAERSSRAATPAHPGDEAQGGPSRTE